MTRYHKGNEGRDPTEDYYTPLMSPIIKVMYWIGLIWLLTTPVMYLIGAPLKLYLLSGILSMAWLLGCTMARSMEILIENSKY